MLGEEIKYAFLQVFGVEDGSDVDEVVDDEEDDEEDDDKEEDEEDTEEEPAN